MCSLSDYLDVLCGNYFMQVAIIFVDVSKLGLGFFNYDTLDEINEIQNHLHPVSA